MSERSMEEPSLSRSPTGCSDQCPPQWNGPETRCNRISGDSWKDVAELLTCCLSQMLISEGLSGAQASCELGGMMREFRNIRKCWNDGPMPGSAGDRAGLPS
jgi:hypothetical protein